MNDLSLDYYLLMLITTGLIVVGMIGMFIFTTFTEAKCTQRLSEKLRQVNIFKQSASDLMYRAYFKQNCKPSIIIDGNRFIMTINYSFSEKFGIDIQEFKGRSVHYIIGDLTEIVAGVTNLVILGEKQSVPVLVTKLDGCRSDGTTVKGWSLTLLME